MPGSSAPGAYALTRLGAAIAETWLEDESLSRQSLVLLTTALRSNLGEVLSAAHAASSGEQWDEVRQQLRVNVASLVEGIDRRRRGLDEQQAEVQARVSELLAESWFGAVDTCETLLDDTTQTLAELKDVLMRETGDLLALLADIEGLAADSDAEPAAEAAREAQLKVDGIAAWGRARHEAWSEYFAAVQRFIREHVRMDPDRALSRRLQQAVTDWPDDPWYLEVCEVRPYLHLREPLVERPRVAVTREAEDRERDLELVDDVDWEADLAARVAAWLDDHPESTLSQALAALLPARQRFRFAGRITRLLASLGRGGERVGATVGRGGQRNRSRAMDPAAEATDLMAKSPFETLDQVIRDEVFPDVDLRLREGGHIDDLDLEEFTFLEDARSLLEDFYQLFGCDLVRSVDGYYYLRPRGDRFGQRQLPAAEMLVGQALCLLRMDPASLQTSWRVERVRVLELLDQLVGADRLGRALNPRRRARSKAVNEEKIRDDVDRAVNTLARLGFVAVDGDTLRLRPSLLRFLEPLTDQPEPQDALGELIRTGRVEPDAGDELDDDALDEDALDGDELDGEDEP